MKELSSHHLGDFEILRELGRGGMGIVYEARQLSLNRKVALKVLGSSLGLTAKAVQRFRREAEAAARLHHTNIVPVYATGEQDGTHFYAMELIDGPSLDRVLRQLRQAQSGKPAKPPPAEKQPSTVDESPPEALPAWVEQSFAPAAPPSSPEATTGQSSSDLGSGSGYFDTVARMIAEVADALDYAHGQGVIHRDIKPSNLLLSPAGRLSVNDFGLARMLEQPGMTLTGEFVGTPKYMSPEQVAAGRIPLDHRTDIYSLGATLYELLTLQPPFSGGSRDQVLAQILQKEPRPPRKLNKKVPVDLETICLKALDKDPDRRYQTAGHMAEDLRRYVNRFAISARRTGPVARLGKWMRRHPALVAALACAGVAIGIAALLGYRNHVLEQERLAEQQRHEQQLLAEKQQRAVDLLQSGDLDAAERAVREAELLAAPAGWLHLRRGELAYHRGQHSEAVAHLEKAVALLPQNAAAHALLAMAYLWNGQMERCLEVIDELEPLPPSAPEDYLYKGLALCIYDSDRGLRTLDEAVLMRDSTIARVVRAQVRALHAMATSDPADAERALRDAHVAKAMLPGNLAALNVSVIVHLEAAALYEQSGQPEKSRSALEQAGRDARDLEQFPTNAAAAVSRFWYFRAVGQDDAAFAEAERAGGQRANNATAYFYSWALYQRGQFQKAVEVVDRNREGRDWTLDFPRAYMLAELPNGRQRASDAYQEYAARYPKGMAAVWGQTILLVLGERQQSTDASRALRQQPESLPRLHRAFWQRLLDYLCGELPADQLRQVAGRNNEHQCTAHYLIALKRLAEGDRAGAREHFQKSMATGVFYFWEYDWSRAFLARMDKDDTWPSWIGPKK